MPIDPYSPCPGGTGKKVKFCCTDLQQELDKVERMLEGEQSKACLDYVRKLDEKYAGRACLQSIRISLENAVGDHAAAHATLASVSERASGTNPVALAEQALDLAAHGDPLAGILWLQQALDICREEMPARVYDAVGALALALLSAGHIVPARAHLQLQMGISQGRDERAVSALLQLEGSPTVPLPLKDMPSLEPAPAGVPWQAAFQRALDDAQRGQWKKAADAWTAVASQASTAAVLWRNLATVRSYLGDYTGAIEALRKLIALGRAARRCRRSRSAGPMSGQRRSRGRHRRIVDHLHHRQCRCRARKTGRRSALRTAAAGYPTLGRAKRAAAPGGLFDARSSAVGLSR